MRPFLLSALSLAMAATGIANAQTTVNVVDPSHSPASNFLAYTEFELSGEPLAEALGLDLDTLDPNAVNKPTAFDYAAGIEAYEYSEEAMYALNYQSQMGPHLVNGPSNASRGGNFESLKKRISGFVAAVGFDEAEVPSNIYPISIPYSSGTPKLDIAPNIANKKGESIDVIDAQGKSSTQNTLSPAYLGDYSLVAWDKSSFDKSINPAAIGGILLKEVMWSQDFLGGMHETKTDEEVEAESSTQDSGPFSLGVSAADGFQGMLLTEISLDKLRLLQDKLAYDGKSLGAKLTPQYDPKKQPIWFPHSISVKESSANGVNALGKLTVNDSSSTLRDTWMLLWPTSEYFSYTDQRISNTAQNPAFLAVFDNAPFAASPKANTDSDAANDIVGSDGFSLASNLSSALFKNIDTLHFNAHEGTFVDSVKDGKQSTSVTTFDAAYSIVALSIYQRAQDALPVGYASAEGGDVNLKTAQGKRALALITKQADFLSTKALTENGLVADNVSLGKKASGSTSLSTQFATIRGLIAAGLATGNDGYLAAAKALFISVEKYQFDNSIGTWADQPGKATIHTPYTAAAISGGLREVILHLANKDSENTPELSLKHLTSRYVSWFKTVINGGAQLAEWNVDTGENKLEKNNTTDSDKDGVMSVIGAGYAATMANQVSVSRGK
ncbi:hypothetical protein A9Q99_07450 [Gammaproteobacteria bacterium 45_16_T64]|mgnify:CR=1 FL=1|nr:hypothetical protein A9Q99_07450 [Gammaproteobacteria bacterium 45_16_T64]